jgi:HSP20 family protein
MKLVIENNNGLKNADDFEAIDINTLLNEMETEESDTELSIGEFYISENKDEYQLEIFVPGFRKEDFIIEVTEDGVLMIKASTQSGYFLAYGVVEEELTSDDFYKSFTLPPHVDEQDIEAYYEDNLLTLLIPKN